MAEKGERWNLEELIDFEFLLHHSSTDQSEVGQEMRREMREAQVENVPVSKRRWGLKYWLERARKKQGNVAAGKRVIAATKILGILFLVMSFLTGVGVIRGLVTSYSYEGGPYVVEGELGSGEMQVTSQEISAKGFNIWVLLAVSLGLQWFLMLLGVFGYFFLRRFSHGLGGLKLLLVGLIKRFSGELGEKEWIKLIGEKKAQRSAFSWRLSRLLQLFGVGYNVGLLIGLLGVLWFTKVGFYWESSLPAGFPSLEKTTQVLSAPWGGSRPDQTMIELTHIRENSDYFFEGSGSNGGLPIRQQANLTWAWFFMLAIMVWGLLPRMLFLLISVTKERSVLAGFDFQDPDHRKLWRELSRVERNLVMEGVQDGVVLCDVGGLEVETETLRAFLLQTLRVNPEERYSVDVMDEEEERVAWAAMKEAPCGVIILVESWNLSPKQFTSLWQRMRREAGQDTVIRVLVLGECSAHSVSAPPAQEFEAWQKFIDGLRDPLMECLAYQEKGVVTE